MTEKFDANRFLAEMLTEHGPLHEADITEHLRSAGVADPAPTLRRLNLEIDVPAVQLADKRWAWLPAVLAGRVFTRRITKPEVNFDLLTVTPDLDPIAALCDYEPYQRLADGSAIQRVTPGDRQLLDRLDIPAYLLEDGGDALALAVGTFESLGVREGDLVGLRLSTAGLVIERVATAAKTTAGARLAALLGEQPRCFDTLVWTACLAAPTLFTEATVPLSELAADRNLSQRGGWLAPPDFNFEHWELQRDCALLALRHRLGIDDAIAVSKLLVLYRLRLDHLHESAKSAPAEYVAEGEAATFDAILRDAGAALADPVTAETFAAETLQHGALSAGGLRLLADGLEPKVPPAARMACRWLRAIALEREGDIAGFERALLAIEANGSDWPPALVDLARIASDRSDAAGGLALLRRAGATADDPLVYLLRQHHVEKRTDLGRNAACWCGSGRKYKKCHLGRLPLPDRAGWLYHKAIQHVLLGNWTDLRYSAAFERCRSFIADDVDAFNAALADPVVIDIILFEGGGFEEFLMVRGVLLPADEQALAEQWILADRSVFEIEDVSRDGDVTARDLRTGERHEVDERTTGQPVHAGQLVCARVAPDGAGMRFFGLEVVPAQGRDALIALLDTGPDPVELVAQLSGNTSGEYRCTA